MRKYSFRIATSLFMVIGFALLVAASTSEGQFPLAPEFKLTDLTGQEISLSDYKGKVVFLNFWATWCPPCRAEIPDFVEVYAVQKIKGMEIIGVSLDSLSPRSLLSFIEKYKVNYPVAYATQKIMDDYKPGEFIPTTIVIDKKGRIRHKHIGLLDKDTLIQQFLRLAAE